MGASLWDGIARTLGAEPREYTVIRGASGVDHQLLSLSVDEPGNRLILVSADPDPRIAAMMQVDVKATVPSTQVLVARPIAIDLSVIARTLVAQFGLTVVSAQQFKDGLNEWNCLPTEEREKRFKELVSGFLPPIVSAFKNVSLPTVSQIVSVIQQASKFDWEGLRESGKDNPDEGQLSLAPLLDVDNMRADREHGICPVPLYEFTQDDWELFLSLGDIERAKERLLELGVYQYFFPAADHLTLGFVDRGMHRSKNLVDAVTLAPVIGHPYGPSELLGNGNIKDVVGDLIAMGLLTEGEFGIETTKEGSKARATVKFRPREGLLAKIINRMQLNVSVSPFDFMK